MKTIKQVGRSIHKLVKTRFVLRTQRWTLISKIAWIASDTLLSSNLKLLSPSFCLHRVCCALFVFELWAWWLDFHGRGGDPGDPEGRGVVDREHWRPNRHLPLQLRQTKGSRSEFWFWELTHGAFSQFYCITGSDIYLLGSDFMYLTEKQSLGSLSPQAVLWPVSHCLSYRMVFC